MPTHEEKLQAVDDFARRLTREKIRFAVGSDDGRHSFVWAAWSQGSEYYLGVNSMLGNIRLSLHKSGICRFALTTKHFDDLSKRGLPEPPDRALTKWKRKPTPETGAVHVLSLAFPTDHLQLPEPPADTKKPVAVIVGPPAGVSVQIGIFYSRQNMLELEEAFSTFGTPLFASELRNGEVVSMVAKQLPYNREMLPRGDRLVAKYAFDSHAALARGQRLENLVAHFWNAPADGQHFRLWEVGRVTIHQDGSKSLP